MLSYDGTAYAGWQVQPGRPTVQGAVVETARRLTGAAVHVVGASRTDAGVHALRQTASLATDSALPAGTFRRGLNALLPADIRVVDAADARPGFEARRQALGKRYAYLVDNGQVPLPLLARYAWHVPGRLDVDAMRRALRGLWGPHDFGAFCAAPGRAQYAVCQIRGLHVVRRKERVALVVSADRFLHHMVRNIVGSVLAVGRGARDPAWLTAVLESRDRRRAGPTAPAHGLTLVRVLYPG